MIDKWFNQKNDKQNSMNVKTFTYFYIKNNSRSQKSSSIYAILSKRNICESNCQTISKHNEVDEKKKMHGG